MLKLKLRSLGLPIITATVYACAEEPSFYQSRKNSSAETSTESAAENQIALATSAEHGCKVSAGGFYTADGGCKFHKNRLVFGAMTDANHSFNEAKDFCRKSRVGGKSDWQLPFIRGLLPLYLEDAAIPAALPLLAGPKGFRYVWGLYPSKGRETAELAFGSMIQVTTDQERPAMAEQFNDTKFGNGDTEIDPFLGGLAVVRQLLK